MTRRDRPPRTGSVPCGMSAARRPQPRVGGPQARARRTCPPRPAPRLPRSHEPPRCDPSPTRPLWLPRCYRSPRARATPSTVNGVTLLRLCVVDIAHDTRSRTSTPSRNTHQDSFWVILDEYGGELRRRATIVRSRRGSADAAQVSQDARIDVTGDNAFLQVLDAGPVGEGIVQPAGRVVAGVAQGGQPGPHLGAQL